VLALAGFAMSCLMVLGFYGYVLVQLYREHKRFADFEKRLQKHLYGMQPEAEINARPLKRTVLPKIAGSKRGETLLHVGVAIGGLLGVFAEIGLLNWLVTSFH
jgi:hypothetical protein